MSSKHLRWNAFSQNVEREWKSIKLVDLARNSSASFWFRCHFYLTGLFTALEIQNPAMHELYVA